MLRSRSCVDESEYVQALQNSNEPKILFSVFGLTFTFEHKQFDTALLARITSRENGDGSDLILFRPLIEFSEEPRAQFSYTGVTANTVRPL